MQGCDRVRSAALRHDIAGATFALAALRGHAKLKLDVVEVQAGTYVAGNLAVRNPVTYTNNHGAAYGAFRLAVEDGLIINTN